MLATRWPEAFTDPAWAWEPKWDGIRALVYADGDTMEIRSRRGNDLGDAYPELLDGRVRRPTVLDGEIVALDAAGRPSFGRLQRRMNLRSPRLVAAARRDTPVSYVVFDVLFDGEEVIGEPWSDRRRRLEAIDLPAPMIRTDVYDSGDVLWATIVEQGLEGVVGKRRASPYRPGVRSRDWRKVTRYLTVRAVVGGFTRGDGARAATFGSLLLGLWDGDGLRFIGAVGSGFDDAGLVAIRSALDDMRTDRSPFHPDPSLPRNATWVEPRLVAMVRVRGWTGTGHLREPTFEGFTDDPATAITLAVEGAGADGATGS